jgi:hypothetical protein
MLKLFEFINMIFYQALFQIVINGQLSTGNGSRTKRPKHKGKVKGMPKILISYSPHALRYL